MRGTTVTLLIGLWMAPIPLRAEQPSADALLHAVQQSLGRQSIVGVLVSIDHGALTLTGEVATLSQKNRARETAWAIYHEGPVHDELTVVPCGGDGLLADTVTRRIRRYVFFSVFDHIEASVEQCTVTLAGSVDEPFKIDDFTDALSRIPGVRAIRDAVRWLPTSRADRQLQRTVARRIYADERFWRRATEAEAPIHVVAADRVITLTGLVASSADAELAGAICEAVPGVRRCENWLREEPPVDDDDDRNSSRDTPSPTAGP